ncbi:dUTP diphosphatase [Candidatus Margulisiibacteriota bacterium]
MSQQKVFIKRLSNGDGVSLPKYMSEKAAGMDVCAAVEKEVSLKPGERKLIPTGFSMALPHRFEAQVRPRSGLAIKKGVSLVNTPGTIDEDYRGEVGIIMINHGQEDFVIKRGDRIAQMVINHVPEVILEEVNELPESKRSSGGFGHTGI